MKNINHQRLINSLEEAIHQVIVSVLTVHFFNSLFFFFESCLSIRPEQPRRRGLWTRSQSLNAGLITCLALKPIFEKKKGQAVHYYCHREPGMQTIIATLRSALSETPQIIELCPAPGNTHKSDSWLLHQLQITDTLSQPQIIFI